MGECRNADDPDWDSFLDKSCLAGSLSGAGSWQEELKETCCIWSELIAEKSRGETVVTPGHRAHPAWPFLHSKSCPQKWRCCLGRFLTAFQCSRASQQRNQRSSIQTDESSTSATAIQSSRRDWGRNVGVRPQQNNRNLAIPALLW